MGIEDVEILEIIQSGAGEEDTTNPGRTLTYYLSGSSSSADIAGKIKADAPVLVDNYVYGGFTFRPIGEQAWIAEVKYQHISRVGTGEREKTPPPVGTARFSFTTRGKTSHLDRAITQESSTFSAGKPVIDMNLAINFDGKTVAGLDVVRPKLAIVVEYTILGTNLTAEYVGKLHYLTGRINSASWHGFEAEEVLFNGADGGIEIGKDTTLTYEFLVEYGPTAAVGGNPILYAKGWDYVWYTSEFSVDNGSPISKLRQVNVAQVYETGDFALLAIPLPTTIVTKYTPP